MRTIRLRSQQWRLNEAKQLGAEGGFGAVFEGTSDDEGRVAIKRLHSHATAFAGRELDVAERLSSREFQHVLPVLDYGQDAESDEYFIVMPLAEGSLEEELQRRGRLLPADATVIALAICRGLGEVSDLVHRDLKPGNILHHEGNWKIADFGIAKFVEDATSTVTLRDFLSAPYAAPEQWLLQRPTSATDVYALGCILYELLTGSPPFRGTTRDEYRDQHLNSPPPPLEDAPARLRSLTSMCLRKPTAARPSLDRLCRQLEEAAEETDSARSASPLADVGARLAEEAARVEAAAQELRQKKLGREALAAEARTILNALMSDFGERVRADAPMATVLPDRITLGAATLSWSIHSSVIPEGAFKFSKWDVVTGGEIALTQQGTSDYYGRSSSLWYAQLPSTSGYRWYEVPYMAIGTSGTSDLYPFALSSIDEADLAASPVLHVYQMAARPLAVDDEDFDVFVGRWAARLAQAAEGRLRRPSRLPE